MLPSAMFLCSQFSLFSSCLRAWRRFFCNCVLLCMAIFLKCIFALSHHFSGVSNSFFFSSHPVQKRLISVVKISSSSKLLLKCQYPSLRGWVFRSKVSDMRSWSEKEKGRMSVVNKKGEI